MTGVVRLIFACVALAGLTLSSGAPADAQSAPAEIEVRVVDGFAKPVPDARVFISGPLSTSALTPGEGVIYFEDVTPGIYAIRVARTGYDGVELPEIEALAGRRKGVTVRITLREAAASQGSTANAPPNDLKVIGSVRARPAITVENVNVDDGSPIRRVSENLADALDKIAGIAVQTSQKTGGITISLRNADAGSAAVSAGGVPLAGGGSATSQSVAAELSTGVSADANSSIGSAGGSVNFRTLEPTRTWQSQFSSSYGSYEKSSAQIALSGSAKKLGVALQHATRSTESPLTGLRFADSSGETYVHDGSSGIDASFIKLRYTLSPKLSFNGSLLGGTTRKSPQCTLDLTLLPCGYGPGGSVVSSATTRSLGLQGQIGNVNVSGSGFRSTYGEIDDERQRVNAGLAIPFRSETTGATNGFTFYGTIPLRRHTFLANVGSYEGLGHSSAIATSAAFGGSLPVRFRYAYTVAGDTYKFSDRWSATLAYGLNSNLTQTRSAVDLNVSLAPSRNELLSFGIGQYGSGSTSDFHGFFTDPASGNYACSEGEVLVNAPADSPQRATTSSANLSYSRRGKRGSIRGSLYTRSDHAGVLGAQYPLAAYTGSPLPAGYLEAIGTVWHQPTICGTQAFDVSRVYVLQQLAGLDIRYRGFDGSGQLTLGRGVIAQASYSTAVAALASLDPRLNARGSPYAVGEQIPQRPLHKASLLLDAVQPRAKIEYVANFTWTSANNASGLGSYVIASAGVTWTANRGRLTLFANNLFNSDTGLFVRGEFLSPLAVRGGGIYQPLPPSLLPPRSYTLLYSVRAGRTR